MLTRVMIAVASALMTLPVTAADDLWEWVTPWPQGYDLYAAATGGGVTVAVGANGTVIASTDGVAWRTSRTGFVYNLSDVVWANGLFVAVGSFSGWEFNPVVGVILTSNDGVDWIERYRTETHTVDAVAWTGSRFVAVGVADKVLLSFDGLSWSEQPTGSEAWTMMDLAWNGSMLVAIGSDNVPWFGRHSYFTSENGDQWTQYLFNRDYMPSSIEASGGRFVAVGSEHDALVSDDGLTWAVAPYESSRELRVIVDGGDRFIAVGNDVVGTSLDGYVWSIEDQPMESRVYGLVSLGDGYLAVGEDGFMMSSPDGSEWTQLSERAFDISGSWEINELAINRSTIVGVGEGSLIITGILGTEWVRRYSPVSWGELNSVIWAGSAFWAVGSPGVLTSIDGVHWAWAEKIDADITLYDIVWNGSLYVAVGRDPVPIGRRKSVAVSRDGHDWSYQEILFPYPLFAVAWTGSIFVAAGDGDLYLTSTDGESWQQHPWPDSRTVTDMAWNGHRAVAVGGRPDVGGIILSTTDGVHWVECELPADHASDFDDVTWTGTHFVAVSRSSGDVIFTSPDGITWSAETTGTGVWPVSVVQMPIRSSSVHCPCMGTASLPSSPPPGRVHFRVLPSRRTRSPVRRLLPLCARSLGCADQ